MRAGVLTRGAHDLTSPVARASGICLPDIAGVRGRGSGPQPWAQQADALPTELPRLV